MARHARLALPGHAHYVLLRGHNGGVIVVDDEDRQVLLQTLREAVRTHEGLLHGYTLGDRELHLLLTPPTTMALSRTMQALGRRYAAHFNRRHGRSGALWDGRYRAAVVEAGAAERLALRVIDAASALAGADGGAAGAVTSAAHRLGARHDPSLTDPACYWQLGNTPFEREARWRELLADAVPAPEQATLLRAVAGGWAYGSAAFLVRLAEATARAPGPRPRGRPPRAGR